MMRIILDCTIQVPDDTPIGTDEELIRAIAAGLSVIDLDFMDGGIAVEVAGMKATRRAADRRDV